MAAPVPQRDLGISRSRSGEAGKGHVNLFVHHAGSAGKEIRTEQWRSDGQRAHRRTLTKGVATVVRVIGRCERGVVKAVAPPRARARVRSTRMLEDLLEDVRPGGSDSPRDAERCKTNLLHIGIIIAEFRKLKMIQNFLQVTSWNASCNRKINLLPPNN